MSVSAANRRARERYDSFVSSLDLVMDALESLDSVIDHVESSRVSSGWTIPTQDELSQYRMKAIDELDRLRASAKNYEAELVSREWRL